MSISLEPLFVFLNSTTVRAPRHLGLVFRSPKRVVSDSELPPVPRNTMCVVKLSVADALGTPTASVAAAARTTRIPFLVNSSPSIAARASGPIRLPLGAQRARQDSNLRLLPPEGSALSTELRALARLSLVRVGRVAQSRCGARIPCQAWICPWSS